MVADPALMPVTFPEASSDTFVLVVLQAPPDIKSLNDIVRPTHTAEAPPIPEGAGLTVTVVVTKHPAPVV